MLVKLKNDDLLEIELDNGIHLALVKAISRKYSLGLVETKRLKDINYEYVLHQIRGIDSTITDTIDTLNESLRMTWVLSGGGEQYDERKKEIKLLIERLEKIKCYS